MSTQNTKAVWGAVIVVVIVLILLGVWAMNGGVNGTNEMANGSNTTTPPSDEVGGGAAGGPSGTMLVRPGSNNAIYVDTQKTGSKEVIAAIVNMEHPGFVVIHGDDNGQPGVVMGSSALIQDQSTSVHIAVDEPLREGAVYYAVLYKDDGDGTFDVTKDDPVTDTDGAIMMMSFEASADADPSLGPINL
jgi:hypothetical protein